MIDEHQLKSAFLAKGCKPVYQAECYNTSINAECYNTDINAEASEMIDEERKRKWIKEMRDKCGKFLTMHTCHKCGKVDGLGVSSAVNMSFLCLNCLANMLFDKTPSLDVKDFAKI